MEPYEPLLWEYGTKSPAKLRRGLKLLSKSTTDLGRGLSCSNIWLSYKSNLVASWMPLHNCRCFQEHLRMLLQSLRALCLAPGGPESIWNYLGAPVRSTGVSRRFVCGFRTYLHVADAVQWTIWTACLLHWKEVTGIATVLCQMYFAWLRRLIYWSCLLESVNLANLLKLQVMWFCSSPVAIAHNSARSSTVLISHRGFWKLWLIGTLVRGISFSRYCFAAFAFGSWEWNTSFWAFIRIIWKVASWPLDCQYTCLTSSISLSGSSEHAFKWLLSCCIWSEKWFRSCIFKMLKSD